MSRSPAPGSKPRALLAYLALACVCSCARPSSLPPPQVAVSQRAAVRRAPELSGTQLLARVRERYAQASSYQDSGTMSSVVDAAGMGASRTSTTFRTAFERQSGRFYFDYNEARGRILPPERVVIWQAQPGTAQIWRTAEPEQVEEDELSGALSAMQGVSNGLTAIAPRLLLPPPLSVEPGPFQMAYQLEGVERIGETPAFRIAWEGQQRSIRMWIRQSDFALIRLVDHQVIAAAEPEQQESAQESLAAQIQRFQAERQNTLVSDTTIDFQPVFGAPLDASEFQFSPPAGG
jgi:hypothetical protein